MVGSPRAAERSHYLVTVHASDGPNQIHTDIDIEIKEANIFPPVYVSLSVSTGL